MKKFTRNIFSPVRICKFPGCKNIAYTVPEEPRELCEEHSNLVIGLIGNCYVNHEGIHNNKIFIPYEDIDKLYFCHTKENENEYLHFEIIDKLGNKINTIGCVPDYDFQIWDFIISKIADRQYAEIVDLLEKQEKIIKVGYVTISRTFLRIRDGFLSATHKYEEISDVVVENGFLYAVIKGKKKPIKKMLCTVSETPNLHTILPYLRNKVKTQN